MHQLNDDSPESDIEQDALNTGRIASYIADSIHAQRRDVSLVYGVFGPWGSGKSTLLDYIETCLLKLFAEEVRRKRFRIIRFNPWWFADGADLTKTFLKTISSELSPLDKALAKFNEGMERLVDAAKGLKVKASVGADWLAKAEAEGDVGETLKYLKRQLASASTVPQLKKTVEEILKALKIRAVVLIDDVDRLTKDEVRELFRTIKALASFKGIIYVVACDRNHVAAALKDDYADEVGGEGFLDKIIQIPVDLPSPTSNALFALFRKEISGVMFDGINDVQESELANAFDLYLNYFVRTPRSVIRLVNALSISFGPVREEVQAIDFLCLEAIRLFLPEVHILIKHNETYFYGSDVPTEMTGMSSDELKRFHTEWLNEIEPIPKRQAALNLLLSVFPKVLCVARKMPPEFDPRTVWHRNKRAACPDCFPAYFRWGVEQDTLAHAKMDRLIAVAHNSASLREELLSLPARSILVQQAFQGLSLRSYELAGSAATVLEVLTDIGDTIQFRPDGPAIESAMNITRHMLSEVASRVGYTRRQSALPAIVSIRNSFGMLAMLLKEMSNRTGTFYLNKEGIPAGSMDFQEEFEALDHIFQKRVDTWISTREWCADWVLREVLAYCRDRRDQDSYSKLIEDLLKSDEGFKSLMSSIIVKEEPPMGPAPRKMVAVFDLTVFKALVPKSHRPACLVKAKALLKQELEPHTQMALGCLVSFESEIMKDESL